MVLQLGFELIEFDRQFAMGAEQFAQLDEGADHVHTDLGSLRAFEKIGGHERAVFGEGVGQGWGEFQVAKVVAICDHLLFFGFR